MRGEGKQGMEATGQANTQRGRLARRFSVATASQAHRRRIVTLFAFVMAALLGYHAFFGANGLSAYSAKRQEDRLLATQLDQLRRENTRLKMHVEHLKTDPDAIEYEAHTRLRYTRPDQVIVLNNSPDGAPDGAAGSGRGGQHAGTASRDHKAAVGAANR